MPSGPVLAVATLGLSALLVTPSFAASPRLVSASNPSASQPAGGNGDSVAPVVTPDGRFVLFTSAANNLIPGDNSFLRTDVFLRDRLSNITALVSINFNGTGGGNSNSFGGMVSANGRYVVFESDASDLVTGDINGGTDLFMRDLQSGTTTLVSVSMTGGPAYGSSPAYTLLHGGAANASTYPVMTPDGRYVAFLSYATNLVAGQFPLFTGTQTENVYVRDVVGGTTTLASVGAQYTYSTALAGTPIMDTPVITPDGRYVAFFSTASNLVSVPTQVNGDVYVRDLVAGVTACVSTNVLLINGNTNTSYSNYLSSAASTHPALSADGRFAAFRHTFGPTNYVYRYDMTAQTGATVSSSVIATPAYGDDVCGPEITSDGRFTAYVATDSNLHLWDGQMATDSIVSLDQLGGVPTNGRSSSPVFSGDESSLAFVSTSTNLVTNIISTGAHVYLRNLQAGTTGLVDVDTNGAGSVDVTGAFPSLSTNAQFIAFASPDSRLVGGDNNRFYDVFVRDMSNDITQLISARNTTIPGQSGNGISSLSQSALTPDGRWLVFASRSEDLVTNDFNNGQDVFVADLLTGSNILVSVGLDGNSASGGESGSPVISTNGRYVAFVSTATNLVANATNAANIFLRDLQAGTTTLVNVNTNGSLVGSGDCSAPVMSADGRYIAFLCQTNRSSSFFGAYWRDTVSNRTVVVNSTAGGATLPLISADGRRAGGQSGYVWVWDSTLGANVYSNATLGLTLQALSPTGSKILYTYTPSASGGQVAVANVDTGSNLITFSTQDFSFDPGEAAWSADERFLAFLLGYPTNVPSATADNNNVLLCDLQAGTITLVSANSARSGAANNHSDSVALSGDGRFVTYRSFATDIAPGITNSPNVFVFDRLTGSNTLLTAQQAWPVGWSSWVSLPSISANGGTIAFQSYGPGLVSGGLDLNFVQDVFAVAQSIPSTTDSVGDGIPDAWRAQYFGGSGTTTNSQSCATCDPDHDGMSNLQEYLAGTDPTSSASVLRLDLTAQVSANSVVLTWPVVVGRSYQVQYKTSLSDAVWQTPAANLWVTGNVGTFTSTLSPASGFYRVIVVN
jgi:hypothetical protein